MSYLINLPFTWLKSEGYTKYQKLLFLNGLMESKEIDSLFFLFCHGNMSLVKSEISGRFLVGYLVGMSNIQQNYKTFQ